MIFETDDSEFVDQIRLSKNFLNDCLKTNLAYNFKYNLYTTWNYMGLLYRSWTILRVKRRKRCSNR